MALEFMADKKENHTASQPYHMPLESKTEAERGWIADWRPLIRNIVHDITEGEKSEVIALGFHRALAMLMTNVANHIQYHHIVLSGGVFQNALLLRLSEAELTKRGFTVYTPHLFGTNDGGLSLGQSMVGIQTFRQNSAPIRETRQTPTH
jgi:hydrogenase maturation protein HypF